MLLIRGMTIVVLGLLGKRWVLAYIGADLGLFIFVKLIWRDFYYWTPKEGNADIPNSLLCRVKGKTIVDFTSLLQLRHPQEVGGAQWMLGFLVTMASLPPAIKIYEGRGGEERIINFAWVVMWYLIPSTLVCFGVLF